MKMSNEKFRVIVLPIVAIIVVLMIVLSMAANTYSAQLDMALGRGQRHVVDADNIGRSYRILRRAVPQSLNTIPRYTRARKAPARVPWA